MKIDLRYVIQLLTLFCLTELNEAGLQSAHLFMLIFQRFIFSIRLLLQLSLVN
jgi:hypothetical protein